MYIRKKKEERKKKQKHIAKISKQHDYSKHYSINFCSENKTLL